ncbi:MAG TPA: PIG-L family deacetylase [Lacunisphaera sp.]|jgi:LmbE family N-acetylglucosaminyl deacetylase|nr:PIG-L family deacetylase [Lacunisphaera sp.]
MRFSQPAADTYVPDGRPLAAALARTTHLCIAAHQDDIEIMAYHGIAACGASARRGFTGVVVTDGAGSPRTGRFANYTDEKMKRVRCAEQRRAARIGGYAAMIQLAHPSAVVKDARSPVVAAELAALLRAMPRLQTVYLHNPADKHDTHVAVFLRSLAALRALPKSRRPKQVLGCEVWRDLDWLVDADKRLLDNSADPRLAARLVGVFQSQIGGGKRYDLAAAGRRLAHATFHTSHATDAVSAITWAMDLTPLVHDKKLSVRQFALAHVDRLRADIAARLKRVS